VSFQQPKCELSASPPNTSLVKWKISWSSFMGCLDMCPCSAAGIYYSCLKTHTHTHAHNKSAFTPNIILQSVAQFCDLITTFVVRMHHFLPVSTYWIPDNSLESKVKPHRASHSSGP